MDHWDETGLEDEADDAEDFAPSREQLVFLIDAAPAMLQPCTLDQGEAEGEESRFHAPRDEFKGKCWLEAAVAVARSIMRQKVIGGGGDQVAVVLYGTAKTKTTESAGQIEQCYVLQDLEQPGADAVESLAHFDRSKFEEAVGSAGEGGAAQALRQAMWLAKLLGGKDSVAKARARRRVLVFTRAQAPMAVYQKGRDPSPEWKALKAQLGNLRDCGAALELYPMLGPGEEFDVRPFWRSVLLELRGGGGDDEELEEGQQVCRIDDLVSVVRSKAHRRRAVASFKWDVGGGLSVAVKMYQMLQAQGIPPAAYLHSENMQEVKQVTTGLVDRFTGEFLAEVSPATQGGAKPSAPPPGVRLYFPNPKHPGVPRSGSRFPKVYVTQQEVATIKGTGQAGMTLLGFKPRSALRDYHQIRNCSFIYPDDRALAGSATAFIALHQAVVEADVMAVCRLAATRAREPRLVALLPQEEAVNEDGWQLEPPGFQAVYLPWADDIRAPEADTSFTGVERAAPSEEAVAAAEALVAALDLPDFELWRISNPALQRHYEVLEARAQGMEPPDEDDFVDYTLPACDAEDPEVAAVAAAFKEALNLDADFAAAASKKRKAAAPAVDAEAVAALNVEELAATGKLGKLTVPQLKDWLRSRGLTLGGNKGELVARIQNTLGV